jgi:hypothetical protein
MSSPWSVTPEPDGVEDDDDVESPGLDAADDDEDAPEDDD